MSYLIASIVLRSIIVAFDIAWHVLVIELLQVVSICSATFKFVKV
jgi:hypothetical protein